MKKLLPLLMIALLLTACAAVSPPPPGFLPARSSSPRSWIMYRGQVYFYYATGLDEPLPPSFFYVGSIETVDHTAVPTADFSGCQVEEGQRVFADAQCPDIVYLEYESGYACFSLTPQNTDS